MYYSHILSSPLPLLAVANGTPICKELQIFIRIKITKLEDINNIYGISYF